MRIPSKLYPTKIKIKVTGKNVNNIDQTVNFTAPVMTELAPKLGNVYNNLGQYQVFQTGAVDITGRPLFLICTKEQFDLSSVYLNAVLTSGQITDNELVVLYQPSDAFKNYAKTQGGAQFFYTLNNIAFDPENEIFLIFSSKKYALAILEALWVGRKGLNI